MTSRLGNRQKLKPGISLDNLSIVAFHTAKVPTNVFSRTLIFHITLDYNTFSSLIQLSSECSPELKRKEVLPKLIKNYCFNVIIVVVGLLGNRRNFKRCLEITLGGTKC